MKIKRARGIESVEVETPLDVKLAPPAEASLFLNLFARSTLLHGDDSLDVGSSGCGIDDCTRLSDLTSTRKAGKANQ